MSGAQTGVWNFLRESKGYNVQELPISAEGDTTVTFYAEDNVGNLEQSRSQVVRIDETPPTITGLPSGCELWPPNNQLVHVADVFARDGLSGLGADALLVTASSNDLSDAGDIVISGGSVALRAAKTKQGATRVYGVRATATDEAGNATIGSATCLVPHSQGQSTK